MGQKILIVDDSAVARKVFSRAVRNSGLTIDSLIEADSGENALDLLNGERVDIIFSDIGMPGMGGVEFIKALRRDQRYSGIPIVVLSGDGSHASADDLELTGIASYLRKPVKVEHLNETLRQVIRNSGVYELDRAAAAGINMPLSKSSGPISLPKRLLFYIAIVLTVCFTGAELYLFSQYVSEFFQDQTLFESFSRDLLLPTQTENSF